MIDFEKITCLAYEALLKQRKNEFPLFLEDLYFAGIRFYSYAAYCKKAGIGIHEITLAGAMRDGCASMEIRPGVYFVFYDDSAYSPRMEHTLLHEVGHIVLGHKDAGATEEIEANFFASQFRAPNILIKEIHARGYPILSPDITPSVDLMSSVFGLSMEAAARKRAYFNRNPNAPASHSSPLDGAVVRKFQQYLDAYFPR